MGETVSGNFEGGVFIFAFQSAPLTGKEGELMYGSKFTQKPRFENKELSRHPSSAQTNQLQNQVSTPKNLFIMFINIVASEEMLHVVHK